MTFEFQNGSKIEVIESKDSVRSTVKSIYFVDEAYEKAYELWVYYHYQCELYDRSICTGRIEFDGIMPASPEEYKLINQNAYHFRKYILNEKNKYEIDETTWQNAKSDVLRLTWVGLQKEYERLFE